MYIKRICYIGVPPGRSTYLAFGFERKREENKWTKEKWRERESDTLICRDISAFMMRKIKFQGESQHTGSSIPFQFRTEHVFDGFFSLFAAAVGVVFLVVAVCCLAPLIYTEMIETNGKKNETTRQKKKIKKTTTIIISTSFLIHLL